MHDLELMFDVVSPNYKLSMLFPLSKTVEVNINLYRYFGPCCYVVWGFSGYTLLGLTAEVTCFELAVIVHQCMRALCRILYV